MKKIVAAILILTISFAGAAPAFAFTIRQPVQLKNAEEPFIDLAQLIGDSEIGKGGNQETSLSGNTDQETPDEEGTETAGGTIKTEAVQTIEQVEMIITVRDTGIKINGASVLSPEALKSSIEAGYKDGMRIRLIDDYAEYNTYLQVLAILDELNHKPVEEQKP